MAGSIIPVIQFAEDFHKQNELPLFALGVVMDDKDSSPVRGRVRVRIIGIHSEFQDTGDPKKGINDKDCPWAYVLQRNGTNTIEVPDKDTVVLIMFMDNDPFKMIIMGQLPTLNPSGGSDQLGGTPDGQHGFLKSSA